MLVPVVVTTNHFQSPIRQICEVRTTANPQRTGWSKILAQVYAIKIQIERSAWVIRERAELHYVSIGYHIDQFGGGL